MNRRECVARDDGSTAHDDMTNKNVDPNPLASAGSAPPVDLDATDRRLLNLLQDGLPVTSRPFAEVAASLALTEDDVLQRLRRLVDSGALSRFGAILNAPQLGGERTLA